MNHLLHNKYDESKEPNYKPFQSFKQARDSLRKAGCNKTVKQLLPKSPINNYEEEKKWKQQIDIDIGDDIKDGEMKINLFRELFIINTFKDTFEKILEVKFHILKYFINF